MCIVCIVCRGILTGVSGRGQGEDGGVESGEESVDEFEGFAGYGCECECKGYEGEG